MSEEQTTPVTEEVQAAPAPIESVSKPQKFGYWWGTGRRKAAVARVRIRPGSGKIQINKRNVDVYFTELQDQKDVTAPLEATKTDEKIDVFVNVKGGGITGQAGAIKMGLARALKDYDSALEPVLREYNFLSRDSRKVERKKYGQPGARKRFQFSKR
ncbi:MAG: 30S ribosomal protein S9 [Phycisphaeraceae bacterium]|nr:30S ribosomal protein S9 [Phycisphaeraceae bacterium]